MNDFPIFELDNEKWNLSRKVSGDVDKTTLMGTNFTFFYTCTKDIMQSNCRRETSEFKSAIASYQWTSKKQIVITVKPITFTINVSDLPVIKYAVSDARKKISYETVDYQQFCDHLIDLFPFNSSIDSYMDKINDVKISFSKYTTVKIFDGNFVLQFLQKIDENDHIVSINTDDITVSGPTNYHTYNFSPGAVTRTVSNDKIIEQRIQDL
jgi:hypothetical protein